MQASKKEYIHILVVVALMLAIGQFPPVAPLTETGMRGIGIIAGILYGWIFSSTIWTSFLGLLMMTWQGILPFEEVLALSFGSKATLLVLFSFILAAVMEQNKVSRFVGIWLLSRRVLNGRPWAFSLVVLITTFLLGTFILPVVGVLLCWSLLYHVFQQIGYAKGDGYTSAMIVGVAFAGALSLGGLPWQVVPQVILGAYPTLTGETLNYFSYVLFTWPMVMLILCVYILFCKYIARIDVRAFGDIETDTLFADQAIVMDKRIKVCLSLLAIYILLMLTPSLLPENWLFVQLLAGIGPTGTLMLLLVIMMWLHIDKMPLLTFQKAAGAIQWEAVILTATALPISYLLTSDTTGIMDGLLLVTNMVLANKSLLVVWLIAMLFVGLFSNVFSCLGILLLPVLCNLAVQYQVSPAFMAIPMLIFIDVALLTPAGSPVAALLHSNRDWVDKRVIYRFATVAILATYLLMIVVGYGWGQLVI